MSYTKSNVLYREYFMQDYVHKQNIVNVPEVFNYDTNSNILTMQTIPFMSISNLYGENMSNVPKNIIKKIRSIVNTLYKANIEYPDITGYNFIKYDDKIWIIDFEHSKINCDKETYDPYILKFINGNTKIWNPRFL